jgi:hypothetical protein
MQKGEIIITSITSNSNNSSKETNIKSTCFSFEPNTLKKTFFNFNKKIIYNNLITKMLWVKVIDFLSYNELKEVGKVNRKFNMLVKNNNVLVKFFKKKNTEYDNIIDNIISFDSFSQLQKYETLSNVS